MQPVEKKHSRGRLPSRPVLLIAGLVLLVILAVSVQLLNRPKPFLDDTDVSGYGELLTHTPEQVTGITVTLRSGESWSLVRRDGTMVMADDPSFPLDAALVNDLLDAACVVSYDQILEEDASVIADQLDVFGLDVPRCTAAFTYADGASAVIRIGDRCPDAEHGFYYMLAEGHPGLYALDLTTAELLSVERQLLHMVSQPVIHAARIDSIRFESGSSVISWQLQGQITDADAQDRWMLSSPVIYPAEGDKLKSLRTNLSNLRVGSFVCIADEGSLAAYGLDQPSFVMTVHMAAGTVGVTDHLGIYTPTDFPEGTVTLSVGSPKNDMVDYVLFDGCIYTAAHYSLQVFMGMKAADTATRYPIRVTLSNLLTLRVEENGAATEWQVTRTERLDADSMPVYDANGYIQYDYSVTRNGEAFDWSVFEAAYNTLLIATVSGPLPEGWQQTEPVTRTFTFITRTGTEHSLAFAPFDPLHDAVLCDGCAMFYLIRSGFPWSI